MKMINDCFLHGGFDGMQCPKCKEECGKIDADKITMKQATKAALAAQEAALRAMWEETKENYCENTFWTEEVVSPGFCTEIQAQCRKLSPLKSNVPCTFENCPLVAIARKELEK